MNISDAGLGLIKGFEGCKLTAYQDVIGVWTIGYGHTGEDVVPGMEIDQHTADQLLRNDMAETVNGVNLLINVDVTQGQFDALCSFAFNCGLGNLRTSTLLKKINAGEADTAGDELLRWNHAGGKVFAGLTRRRQAERELYCA